MTVDKNELDCLLIHTPRFNEYYKPLGPFLYIMVMSMGLFSIADFLNKNNFKSRIIHLGVELINDSSFSLKRYIKKRKPKIIGISLHWNHQAYDVIKMADRIKEIDEDIFIVLGGFTASFFNKEIVEKYHFIDGIIRGDGEKPMVELAKAFFKDREDLFSVPNLTWRRKDKIIENNFSYTMSVEDFNDLNFTNYSLLEHYELYRDYVKLPWEWIIGLSKYINKKFILQKNSIFFLPLMRGCITNCSYCGGSNHAQKIINNRTEMIFMDSERITKSIMEAKSYRYETMYMGYCPGNDAYFHKIFDNIMQKKIRIGCILDAWGLPSRELIEHYIYTFRNSDVTQIYLSPESGSEKVRSLNKGFSYSNEALFNTINNLEDLNIDTILFFSLGLPYETDVDIEETNNLIKRTKSYKCISKVFTQPVQIEPASLIFTDPDRYNIKLKRKNITDFCINNDGEKRSYFEMIGYDNKEFNSNIQEFIESDHSFEKKINKIKCSKFCRLNNYMALRNNLWITTTMCTVINYFWKFYSRFSKFKKYSIASLLR